MQMVTLADVGCLLLQTPLSGFKQRKGMPWNPQREILNFATNYLVRISRRRHRTRRRCWTGRRRIRGRGRGTRGRTPEWATSISSPHQVKQDIGGKEKLIQNYFSDPQVEPCLSLLMCPLQIITRQSLAGKLHNSEPLKYKDTQTYKYLYLQSNMPPPEHNKVITAGSLISHVVPLIYSTMYIIRPNQTMHLCV